MRNGVLRENEKQANRIAAKVMRITFGIFTLVYLLNVLGVFVVPMHIMTFAYIAGAICLWLPTVLANFCKLEGYWVKYVVTLCAVAFVTLATITLNFHVIVLYVYGIAIAGLYFSRKVNIFATILTVIGVSLGQVLAFSLGTLRDDNFPVLEDVIIYSVVPRALVLIAIAAIFTMLSNRTATLLSNLMGAEEQKEMLEYMQRMRENAAGTSNVMLEMVSELGCITHTSLQANQKIAEESNYLLQGSVENTEAVAQADGSIEDIAQQLIRLSEMNHNTAALAIQIGQNTKDNQLRMEETTNHMAQIHKSANECSGIISRLGDESKEILGIIKTITGISNQTNILALNASIEAARAGEQGKGFAVVAQEIQELSEKTKSAVEHIGSIVHQVVKNTEDAVSAMELSASLTREGMSSIDKANESSRLVSSSNEEMAGQIRAINEAAEIIRSKSDEVAVRMRQISNNTQRNCQAVEQVTAASQENRAGAESLAEIVEQIRELSNRLNEVVKEA